MRMLSMRIRNEMQLSSLKNLNNKLIFLPTNHLPMTTLWCKNQENPSDRISHAWAPLRCQAAHSIFKPFLAHLVLILILILSPYQMTKWHHFQADIIWPEPIDWQRFHYFMERKTSINGAQEISIIQFIDFLSHLLPISWPRHWHRN